MKTLEYQTGIARDSNARFGFKIIKFCQGVSKRDYSNPEFSEREFFAFIAIEPQNLGYFNEHYKPLKTSDFSAFGDELLRGWGTTPHKDILKFLSFKHNIEFGIDPAYALHLSQLTQQAKSPTNALENGYESVEKHKNPATDHVSPISFHDPHKYPEKPADAQNA